MLKALEILSATTAKQSAAGCEDLKHTGNQIEVQEHQGDQHTNDLQASQKFHPQQKEDLHGSTF